MFFKRTSAAALAMAMLLAPTLGVAQGDPPKARPEARAADVKRPDPKRFDKQVDAYLQADKQSPPAPCSIAFLGSASIVAWKSIQTDLAPAPVYAHGLGASTVEDQIYFFNKLATPYKPRAIFLYAGENDIVNGLEPAEVLADMKTFMDLKTKELGATPVYYIAAKASPARIEFAPRQQQANDLVASLAKSRTDLHYIDVSHAMWQGGKLFGSLRPIFVADGIHLNPEGYSIWTRIIKPYVDKEAARKNACKA